MRAHEIDMRAVYLALFIVLIIPFLVRWRFPVYVSPETRAFYEAVERADDGKIVLLMSNWGPGTQGENDPQYRAIVKHLLRSRKRFALISLTDDPIPIAIADKITRDLIEEERKRSSGFKWRYGVEWINLGYKPGPLGTTLQALSADIWKVATRDYTGKEISSFEIMKGLRTMADVRLFITCVAGREALDVIGIVKSRYRELEVVTATMSIVATSLYPYLDSGQLSGMLDGLRGANEYESMLDPSSPPSPRVNALTLGHLFLISLVILGNIGYMRAKGRPSPRVSIPPVRMAGERYIIPTAMGMFLLLFLLDASLNGWRGWERMGMWIGAFFTISVFSFLFGDNVLYKAVEHVIIGGAAALGLYFSVKQVLLPKWWIPMIKGFAGEEGGNWLLVFALIPGAMWYFTYSRRYRWMSKIIAGAFMGMGAGISLGAMISLVIPLVVGTFKPLSNPLNLIYVSVTCVVLSYFVFTFGEGKGRVGKGSRYMARIFMMIGFGALFGNTVATRLSWLIDRIAFLLRPLSG
jgi:hypothetical protein